MFRAQDTIHGIPLGSGASQTFEQVKLGLLRGWPIDKPYDPARIPGRYFAGEFYGIKYGGKTIPTGAAASLANQTVEVQNLPYFKGILTPEEAASLARVTPERVEQTEALLKSAGVPGPYYWAEYGDQAPGDEDINLYVFLPNVLVDDPNGKFGKLAKGSPRRGVMRFPGDELLNNPGVQLAKLSDQIVSRGGEALDLKQFKHEVG